MMTPAKRISAALFLAMAAALGLPDASPAQDRTGVAQGQKFDVYRVEDVSVDVTAGTAAAARSEAIRSAQQQAFEEVMHRITLTRDWPALPELDNEGINALVTSIEVGNERYSARRYIADVTVTFSRSGIRRLLSLVGLPYAETQTPPIVVLPVFRSSGLQLLWDDPNPWAEAWKSTNWQGHLLPFVIPEPSLSNMTLISASQAAGDYPDRRRAIAERYDANGVLVPLAREKIDPATGEPVLAVTVRRYQNGVLSDEYGLDFYRGEGEERQAFLDRAARSIGQQMIDQWKETALIDMSQESDLAAIVPIYGFADWLVIQQRLADTPMINRVIVDSLGLSGALVTLKYLGTEDQLSVALSQYGLNLRETEDGWILGMPSQRR
ncbi:MAG: DUF2066 domain-containing protein [Alphaproteobacteria bacterium]|nr:DUF2066 domain-containing protein [Alphaproteobacteria bacterium]